MTDPALVTGYIFTDFIPNLWVPFLAGLIIIGLLTRFARNL